VLILALLCLAVLAVVQGSLLKSLVAQRRMLREQAHRHQARWLAEAGVERAAWRLRADTAYRGETWELTAEELGSEYAGAIEIEVENVTEHPNNRLVRVRGLYPRDLPARVMYRKEPVLISDVGKVP
jgi:Tfp pilus assembly protein PilX